tara:strand:+ start:16532 stop:17173 length:642 start_codon:yes stop_codon:yes gene_type:complete
MPFKVSSRKSRLYLDDEMKDQIGPYLACPIGIDKGCLSIEPDLQNILVICEHLLYRFIRTGGVFRQPREDMANPSMNVIRKYGKLDKMGDINWFSEELKYKNPSIITGGWCYLLSGTLHRFFFKSWDLYRNSRPLSNGDYHWWLQDKEGNIIDLTEEQFSINKIPNCRLDGYRSKPLGLSYSVKTRNMAFTVLNDLCGSPIDINVISVSGYNK